MPRCTWASWSPSRRSEPRAHRFVFAARSSLSRWRSGPSDHGSDSVRSDLRDSGPPSLAVITPEVSITPADNRSGRHAELAMHDELAARHCAITLRLAGRTVKSICRSSIGPPRTNLSRVGHRRWLLRARHLDSRPRRLPRAGLPRASVVGRSIRPAYDARSVAVPAVPADV
jgi:hypothetical protein